MPTLDTIPVSTLRPPVEPDRRGLFSAALAAETTKFRSVRSTVWTLLTVVAATVGIGAIFCAAEVARWDQISPHMRAVFDPTLQSLNGIIPAQLAIGVLGVLVISSEYTTGTIRTTLAAIPQRKLILGAKVVVFAAAAMVVRGDLLRRRLRRRAGNPGPQGHWRVDR